MAGHQAKASDCVAMKRRIQQRIGAATRGMDPAELLGWSRRRVGTSRFAALFPEHAAAGRGGDEK